MKHLNLNVSIAIVAILLIINPSVTGQEFEMKFGKIDSENLKMQSFEQDTSVSAMVIGDIGNVIFVYNQEKGFTVEYSRHTRIKIFKKEGYEFADQMLELYSSNGIREELGRLRAATYNMDGRKVVTSKMDKKASVFRDDINEYWKSVKFTLPEVREGSIIEFEYSIKSDRIFSLPTWYFQTSIPVLWSEFNVVAPEYLEYKQIGAGYEPLTVSSHTTGHGSANIAYGGEFEYTRSSKTVETINFSTNIYRMVAVDVPPFIEEPMLTTKENYITKINFELARTEYPNVPVKLYTQTWESINLRLIEHSNFGEQMKFGLFLNKPLEDINSSVSDPLEKMVAIHKYIQDNMKWDGFYSLYSSSLRSASNEKSGNIADINLMLILMLQKAGFDTYPVLLSTRSNGFVNKYLPSLSSFNYVVALVKHEGNSYLMDASDPYSTVNMLPTRCLNGEGLIVEEDKAGWVNLNPQKSMDSETVVTLEMDQKGDFNGTIMVTDKDYAAAYKREEHKESKSQDDYIESFEEDNEGLEVENYRIHNLDEIYQPLREIFEVRIKGVSNLAGDIFYINPMLYERMESNIFRIDERKYPVDFGYPIHDVFKLSLTLPDGFIVDELPESVAYEFGKKKLLFSYRIEVNEGVISLINELHINDVLFLYDEYKELREFFNGIVAKHSEMIVLKRTESSGE
jgi:hypothetical protein